MSTRSNIAVENTDGTIVAVYCHHDGYLSGVGDELLKNWTEERKVRNLLTFGGMSALGSDLSDSVFYCRDRGEDLDIVRYDNRKAYQNGGEEYNYLFVPGKGWLVSDHHSKFVTIPEAIDLRERDEGRSEG